MPAIPRRHHREAGGTLRGEIHSKLVTERKEHIMQSTFDLRPIHVLVAAVLGLGATAAQAVSGLTISRDQEALIAVGMGATEVERAIGRPDQIARRPYELGSIWTYEVAGPEFPVILFDVDFGTDGKVERVGERMDDEID